MIPFSFCIQRYCPFQSISYDAQEDNIRTAVKKVVQWGGWGWWWMSDSANYQSDIDLTTAVRVYAFPGFGINVFFSRYESWRLFLVQGGFF